MSKKTFEPFIIGGISSCNAELITFPSDLVKTRLQIQSKSTDSMPSKYRGMVHCFKMIIKEEGISALYNGIKPALLRQATYGTLKLGFYHYSKKVFSSFAKKSPKDQSLIMNMICGMVSGASANSICNPTDVLKVRMQSNSTLKNSKMLKMFKEIYHQEGFAGLYRGVLPNAQRAAVITALELSTYDSAKSILINQISMTDGLFTHLAAGSMAGFVATVGALPIDVVKTRMMNQKILKDGSSSVVAYKGSMDCFVRTIRQEGFSALYKGFLPSYLRIAPFNIIFFLTYEKLKR
jgi:solute carrier family 25 protein 14/30